MGPDSSPDQNGPRRVGFAAAVVVMMAASLGIGAMGARFNAFREDSSPAAGEGVTGSRAALRAEIARRRPVIEAEREALGEERRAIQVERRGLDALKLQVERRRGRGLLAVDIRLDRLDMSEFNRRSKALGARIDEFNRRVQAQRQAVAEFNALVSQYKAGR